MENQQLSSQEVVVGQFDRRGRSGSRPRREPYRYWAFGAHPYRSGGLRVSQSNNRRRSLSSWRTSRITASSFGKPVATTRTMLCRGTRP